MIRFQHIELLAGLVVIPVLVILFLLFLRWKKGKLQKLGDPRLVKDLMIGHSPGRVTIKFIIALLSLAAIITGAGNMQKPGQMENVNRKGIDVMIAMDVSKSMLAEDVKPNRLEKAKQLVNKLFEQLQNDRVGLVLFAGRAYIQMPLTTDFGFARMYVQNANPDAVPSQGTVIAEALRISNTAFDSRERKFKSIILISDGEDHDPQAIQMSKTLYAEGVMINTIGIGSPEGVPIVDHTTNELKKDAQGNAIITKLNEAELQQLAANANGAYIHLDNINDAANQLKAQLDTIEQKKMGDEAFVNYKSYFQWFLAAALLLLILEIFTAERKPQLS